MYEVVQIFPDGYEQHISIADTLEEAIRDIQEFPEQYRHNGVLEIKKRAENWGGDPEGKLAKALERARKKAKQPRKPLKIERLKAESPSYMADSDAHKLMEASWRINSFVESGEEYPEWWKSRLSVAASTVDDLADYLSYTMSDDYDAETFNAPYPQHNPYSVDLIEEEGQHPYFPYLAPEYTTVYGQGRYRFNRYGTDGMTHEQNRFPTKDKAIEWLCYAPHQYRWVKPHDIQYDFPPNTPDSEIEMWYRAESFGAEDENEELFDCVACDKTIYEKDDPQDDELCDGCLKTHKQCAVCQDYEPYNEMMSCFVCGQNYCGNCEKYDSCDEYGAETRSLAKRSWDALNNVETAVGTVGLAHMIGLGAIFGGGLAFLKARKSNSKTEK